MKCFNCYKHKDICALGIGFVFNDLFDHRFTHRFEIVVLYWTVVFLWNTDKRIGK